MAATASALLITACSSSKSNSTNTTASTATTASGGSTATTSAGGGALTASDTGVSPTTIKIGYITSVTGVASSAFGDAAGGAQAAISAANAAGGVDGRQIQLVSLDQSTPAGFNSAAQAMTTKRVFGVIPYSSFTFGGYKTLQQAGIPVTGNSFDGPEWGQEPNSNMLSILPPTSTTWGGKYYYPNFQGHFLQQIGVKKPAGFAYGISPSSQASIKVIYADAAATGMSNCYANYSVPFGGVDFTADVLSVKNAGCDAVIGSFVDASDQAMANAVTQAGLNIAKLWYTGYDQNTLATPAAKAAFEGSYFLSQLFFDPSVPQMNTMLNNLAKYDSGYKAGSLPDYGTWGSYVAAQLMIYGLQQAGQNPTRKTFISKLRQVSSWDDNGLLPSATAFTSFGTPQMIPQSNCAYFVQLKNGAFVNAGANGKAVCSAPVVFPAG